MKCREQFELLFYKEDVEITINLKKNDLLLIFIHEYIYLYVSALYPPFPNLLIHVFKKVTC